MTVLYMPARGRVTTYHGQNIGRDGITGAVGHVGIDLGHGQGAPQDLEVRAPAYGRVSAIGVSGSYGLRLIIKHEDGTSSLLAHLDAAWVQVGETVRAGQLIARMGNSGTVFVHLHWEYRSAIGVALNPLAYLAPAALPAIEPIRLPTTTDTGDPEMLIILTTPAHGHYLAQPGKINALPAELAAGVLWNNDHADADPNRDDWKGAEVWRISPDHLATYLFSIAGWVSPYAPPVGTAWTLTDAGKWVQVAA